MGQYHVTVNLSKKEFLNPHGFGCGLKLWEQIDTQAGVPTALMALLACSNGRGSGDLEDYADELDKMVVGRWAGDRVAVVGDYAEDGDLGPEDHAGVIYDLCSPDGSRLDAANDSRELAAQYRAGEFPGMTPERREAEARRLEEKAHLLVTMEIYRDITPLVAAYLERLCGVRYEGDGWKKVADMAGRQVPRLLAPDMVVTSEGIQDQPRFVVGEDSRELEG